MKIKVEHNGQTVEFHDDDVVDICDALDLMERSLLEIGFSKERLDGAYIFKAKEAQGQWE